MNPQNLNEFDSSIAQPEKYMLQKNYTSLIWLIDGKIKASLEIVHGFYEYSQIINLHLNLEPNKNSFQFLGICSLIFELIICWDLVAGGSSFPVAIQYLRLVKITLCFCDFTTCLFSWRKIQITLCEGQLASWGVGGWIRSSLPYFQSFHWDVYTFECKVLSFTRFTEIAKNYAR